MIGRVLPHDEWPRLAETELPPLLPFMRPEDSSIVVVEDAGKVVASLAVMRATHFEGLWLAPEHRGNPGISRKLIKLANAEARKHSNGWAIGGAADDQMKGFLERLGGVLLPLDFYALWIGDKRCRQQ